MADPRPMDPEAHGEAPVPQEVLDGFNVAQHREENKAKMDEIGGVDGLVARLGVDVSAGCTSAQLEQFTAWYGLNQFPEKPMQSFFELFIAAFNDFTLMVLIVAAVVSLLLGIFLEGNLKSGWIEGTAILIAVLIVATVTAGNDYTKELQFRALEKSSQADEECTVLRNGTKLLINPTMLTVGDIVVLQAGDGVPADGVIVDNGAVKSNESALTGEAEQLKKSKHADPFLLSSCTITEAEEVKMMVFGIGPYSQWGRIRANLVEDAANTPLQDKLDDMAKSIGYIGTIAAVMTFIVMFIYIFVHSDPIAAGIVHAFIIAVTIVVVAIPEGLPLAVTISLAYSTRRMYEDQNLIRVLSACETMGNATDICSDKTGTLTENRMTVVEGWFGSRIIDEEQLKEPSSIPDVIRNLVGAHVCLNRVAYLIEVDSSGNKLHRPEIVGNATEGALIIMARRWGIDYEDVMRSMFETERDKVFAFNSKKKRSTTIVHLPNGTVRLYCKGAPEWVLNDCSSYSVADGSSLPLDATVRTQIDEHIVNMANRALRTLCIAHRDFASAADLPEDWQEIPPDSSDLICDAVVGIIDPLRGDVREAVRTAQSAGVTVRMVTGDNINTACAIARQCGILKEDGIAMEGPVFRNLTPREVDAILPKLQVLARSSPDDKFMLVTRLNGHGLPENKEQWEEKHPGYSWEKDRDRLLPGYAQEWAELRQDGGQIVGVTGDGTNDAPALKAADVGLSMGITGTRVAKDASDIVILDDKFSSIVRAILWGRSVYDNIRKFLQFQLTVNIVALTIVFIGALSGVEPPLNAVMMLWVNLIMDTMGALALGTEMPTNELLERKPYKRSAFLLSRLMMRHLCAQSIFQLILLLILMFAGPSLFNVEQGSVHHNTIVFNTFVFCQVFNEINSRSITDKWNVYDGLFTNKIFVGVLVITIGLQALLVEFGGDFTRTDGLSGMEWMITILLALITLPVGILMRFVPVEEDPKSFFDPQADWGKFLSILQSRPAVVKGESQKSFNGIEMTGDEKA